MNSEMAYYEVNVSAFLHVIPTINGKCNKEVLPYSYKLLSTHLLGITYGK